MTSTDAGDASRSVLESLRPDESELAFRDDLTGLYNYRLLNRLFEESWPELVSLSPGFALVLMDLNLFKQVNDRYGHLAGDEVLKATAEILRRNFRKGDFLFRYGGDEFVVLLPGAEAEEARVLGERARAAMLSHEFVSNEGGKKIEVPVSFSIGVSVYPVDAARGLALLASADGRLYDEKNAYLSRIRRRRRILSGVAVLLALVAIPLAVSYLRPKSLRAPAGAPPPIVVPPPATASAGQPEAELLMQIQQLTAQIETLTRERESSGVPAPPQKSEEIQKLERQVTELTTRLASQQAARATDTLGGSAAAPPSRQPSAPAPAAPQAPATSQRGDTEPPQRGEPEARIVVPSLLQPVVPRYPSFARERGVEATVQLRLLIDEEGHVVRALLAGPLKGFGLDEAAQAAALSSRWRPGTRNGVPVPMEANLQVIFKLRQ